MNEELDILQRATRALREETAAPERRAGLTRARVLDAAAAKKRALWRFFVTLGLVLGTSTALARVAFPEQVSAIWQEIVAPMRAPEPPPAKVAQKKRAPRPKPAPAPVVAPAPAEVVVPVAAPEPSPLEITRKREPAPQSPAPSEAPVLAIKPSSEPAESAELLLFRRAERLHRAHDREAIAAWDAYLRVAPSGALVPEARYNRAHTQVSARRYAEAHTALAAFAAGEYGGYRAREARALIDQLRADAGISARD
jgi:hypothetical protein